MKVEKMDEGYLFEMEGFLKFEDDEADEDDDDDEDEDDWDDDEE